MYERYLEQQRKKYAKSKPIKDWRKDLRGSKKSNAEAIRLVKTLGKTGIALDIGCGEGYHTEDLKNIIGEAIGFDVSKKRVKDANRFGRTCFFADMHYMPFRDNTFDLVYAHEVVEHCADLEKALKEIRRVLKPDGGYVFTLPCEGHWVKKPRATGLLEKFDWSTGDTHFLKIKADELQSFLYSSGFSPQIRLYTLGNIEFRFIYNGQKINFKPHAFVVGDQ